MNAVEIEEAISELAAQPFDRAEFPFAFLEAFGRKANTLKQLRAGTTNASDLPGGVLQRNNIHIINLERTVPLYEKALGFIKTVAADNGTVLFVGTKRQAQQPIAEAAARCAQYYMNSR